MNQLSTADRVVGYFENSWVEKAEYSTRDPHILLQEGALARLAKLKPKKP